jgi:2-keto-4-pentenoate hydratase/2-oxohepta-3-ene-1,7-dioic acid hydratase in catechol pathway
VQSQSTADLIFDVPHLVSFISQAVTLLPGDAIFTGTPGTTGAIKAGDIVEVEIEGIGILQNGVADEV